MRATSWSWRAFPGYSPRTFRFVKMWLSLVDVTDVDCIFQSGKIVANCASINCPKKLFILAP